MNPPTRAGCKEQSLSLSLSALHKGMHVLHSGYNRSHLQQSQVSAFSMGKLSPECKTTLTFLKPHSEVDLSLKLVDLSLKLEPGSDI